MNASGSESTRRRPDGPRWVLRLQVLLLVAYSIYYIWLAFGPSIELVINSTVDDSYYYLVVARNFAAGLGSTFDGTTEITNGYHPLWMGLLVPLYLVVHDPETGLRLTLLLSGALALGMLVFLRGTLNRAVGGWAGLVLLIVFAWPRFFGLTQNALETALLLLLYAAILRALVQGRFETLSQRVGFGLLLGFAMLARLDTVFLVFAAGLWALFEWVRGGTLWDAGASRDGRPASAAGRLWSHLPLLAVAIPVLPYLFWNLSVFGNLEPVSGAMKTTFPTPGFHPGPFRDFPEYAVLAGVALVVLVLGSRKTASRFTRALGLFGLAALLHGAYTVLFMVWAVDRWHFALLVFLALTAVPALGQQVLTRVSRPLAAAAILAGVAGAVAVQVYSFGLREGRYQSDTYHLALWVRGNLPEDAVLSATDSGVLAYFSERSTVNLDGLINSFDYFERLRAGGGQVEEYLAEKGVGYILDQCSYGLEDVLSGNYEVRPLRITDWAEGRVAAEIPVRPEDEAYRLDVRSRRYLGSAETEPNSIILYRYRPSPPEPRYQP